jgi:hypothetical protein
MAPLLSLGKVDAGEIVSYLYGIFHRDFVAQRTHLNGTIWIDPQSHRKEEGREQTFWHLTTRTDSYFTREGNRSVRVTERLTDFRRSERLEWVKLIIDQHANPQVRAFYHQESNEKKNIRLYLWAHQHDFVVILQKLGRSASFLVTSFYVDHDKKRRDYQRRFDTYQARSNPELHHCEWF